MICKRGRINEVCSWKEKLTSFSFLNIISNIILNHWLYLTDVVGEGRVRWRGCHGVCGELLMSGVKKAFWMEGKMSLSGHHTTYVKMPELIGVAKLNDHSFHLM